jgi:hypothetical protein
MSNIIDIEEIYTKKIINKHSQMLNHIVLNINTSNNKEESEHMVYFRIFFMYYLITAFVYKPDININQIKRVFFKWIDTLKDTKNKQTIITNFELHFNYFFKIFFVDKNIYFHTYFNNLIKYFLPLPFELNMYSPIITYRTNVNHFYKTNNIDYLDKPNVFDLNNKYSYKYNINDIDIHIPIKYFDETFFSDIDIIYLVAKSKKIYIVDKNKKMLYSRINNFNSNAHLYLKKFLEKQSLEEMFPIWQNEDEEINFDDSFYICVMKKITCNDLFNVFARYNIKKNEYPYLYHNTSRTENDLSIYLKEPMFFYLIPTSKSKYFSMEKDRHCLVSKVENDIIKLLDLTNSIVTNNVFTSTIIENDRKNKEWISFDPSKTSDFYKNKTIPTKFDGQFKCLTTSKSDLKSRKYCDIYDYSGRRKLQEILFKTRKYRYKLIYLSPIFHNNQQPFEKYRIYHPLNIPIGNTWDFDKYVLYMLKCNGFFFVDYGDAIDGGEILLIKPYKFINKVIKSNMVCHDTNAFKNGFNF